MRVNYKIMWAVLDKEKYCHPLTALPKGSTINLGRRRKMQRSTTFALRWQDLVQMSRDHQHTYIVKTFDGEIGRVTTRGLILVIKGINATTNKPFKLHQLLSFKEAFIKVKSVSSMPTKARTRKTRLIADRRYPNQKLMTFPYSNYNRSGHTKFDKLNTK